MTHTIEPGDVVMFSGTHNWHPGGLRIVQSIDGDKFIDGFVGSPYLLSDVTLIAKGLANLPKTIDDEINLVDTFRFAARKETA